VGSRRAFFAQQGSTKVRIEYVKSRHLLRLVVWHASAMEPKPLEVPLQELVDQLSIEPSDLGQTWYLLFTAREGERCCGHHLVRTFDSLAEGRAAFVRLRETAAPTPGGWVELVALGPTGRVKQVCWDPQGAAPSAEDGAPPEVSDERRTGQSRRRLPGHPATR